MAASLNLEPQMTCHFSERVPQTPALSHEPVSASLSFSLPMTISIEWANRDLLSDPNCGLSA